MQKDGFNTPLHAPSARLQARLHVLALNTDREHAIGDSTDTLSAAGRLNVYIKAEW